MLRHFVFLCLVGSLLGSQSIALGQDSTSLEQLKKEIDLLKREIDLLKRENDLLKKENAELKKGGTAKKTDEDPNSVMRVTVGKVEYEYQGTTRNGATMVVTVLATSKDGIQGGPHGHMTIVDPDGEKYTGTPVGPKATLREGIPVKLKWQFGRDAFTGAMRPVPSTKITRFAGVMIKISVAKDNSIDFRNVPAVIEKAKTK